MWEADRHYIIAKDITLAENATLIIDRGAGLWDGIKTTGTNAKTTLNFAKIENAQYGLSLKSAEGDIGHCMIKNSDFGVYCTHESNVNVSKTTFAGNATNIHIEGLSNAHIDGNMLVGDNERQSEDIGIYTNNSYTPAANNICTNLSKGIKLEYNGDVEIQKNIFDGNEYDVTTYMIVKTRIEKNTFLSAENP